MMIFIANDRVYEFETNIKLGASGAKDPTAVGVVVWQNKGIVHFSRPVGRIGRRLDKAG